MHVLKRSTCRVCASRSLRPVIELGEQHLQGSFIKKNVPAPIRRLPMTLVRCDPMTDENACGLLQAQYTVPPQLMYQQYWYRSGTNATMRDHLRGLVSGITSKATPGPALDIGCNDGTLLGFYPDGWERWGVDPSNIARDNVAAHTHILNDFFPSSSVMAEIGDKKFSVVTAIAMFYDLEDPVGFAKAVRDVLASDGIFCVEMSHMPAMLMQNSYDTICHEHIEYYSLAVIENIMRRADLRVVSVSENTINGGSLRCHIVRAESAHHADESVAAMRAHEFDLKLDTDEPYIEFQKRADLHRKDLLALLRKLKSDNASIHVYGASTKGNTLLQWCGIDWRLVDAAADRNEDKHGARTPGTEIPIISEEESRRLRPDYYLVLPWHFRDEFIEREREALSRGTRLIFPLPNIEVVAS